MAGSPTAASTNAPAPGESEREESGQAVEPSAEGSQPLALPTLPSVDLEDEADFGDGVTARVAKVRAVNADASGAGEISGPAVAFTIELRNDTSAKLPMDTVNVVLVYGDQDTPALPVTGDRRAKPFTGSLKPETSKSAVYIFTVPKSERDGLTLTVSHASLSPIVAFQGAAPS